MGVTGRTDRAGVGVIRQPDCRSCRYGGASLPRTKQLCVATETARTNEAKITASQTDPVPRAIEAA